MSARDDFMAIRRAAQYLRTIASGEATDQVTCKQILLERVSSREADFIRLRKAGIQAEVIDLAWAVLGEERPGGSAVAEANVIDTGR
jgi:hypothetical protein